MKITDAIERANALYPNNYTDAEKIGWCNELGAMLKSEYARSYLGKNEDEYIPITNPNESDTLAPAPYDEMYIDFILAKCCYYQRDFDAYNQHITAFNSKLKDFASWYISHNMPKRDSENKIINWW